VQCGTTGRCCNPAGQTCQAHAECCSGTCRNNGICD
jgi:hypothetical protein